jgi:antirestriction protein ArdC
LLAERLKMANRAIFSAAAHAPRAVDYIHAFQCAETGVQAA